MSFNDNYKKLVSFSNEFWKEVSRAPKVPTYDQMSVAVYTGLDGRECAIVSIDRISEKYMSHDDILTCCAAETWDEMVEDFSYKHSFSSHFETVKLALKSKIADLECRKYCPSFSTLPTNAEFFVSLYNKVVEHGHKMKKQADKAFKLAKKARDNNDPFQYILMLL